MFYLIGIFLLLPRIDGPVPTQDSLRVVVFPIEHRGGIIVEQSDYGDRRSADPVGSEDRTLRPDGGAAFNTIALQKCDELTDQLTTAADSDADFSSWRADIAIAVDKATPEVTRLSERRRSDPLQVFGSHPEPQKRIGQRGRSYCEPGLRMIPEFAVLRSPFTDFVFGLQEHAKFFEVPAIASGEPYRDDGRSTARRLIYRSVGEEESCPVGSIWRDDVEGIAPVTTASASSGSVTQGHIMAEKSITDVVRAYAERFADLIGGFSSGVSFDDQDFLFFGEPDAVFFVHLVTIQQLLTVHQGAV